MCENNAPVTNNFCRVLVYITPRAASVRRIMGWTDFVVYPRHGDTARLCGSVTYRH